MEVLSKLFGSEAKVKIMRLFIFNPEDNFDVATVSHKSQVNAGTVKKEFAILEKAQLIKRKVFYKVVKKRKRGKVVEVKIKSRGYCLNQDFLYITALKQLLISTKTLQGGEIVKRLAKAGALKLVILAGVFTQDRTSRLDMMIVGNNLKKNTLANVVKSIEAELGTELIYAYFDTADFKYRFGMYDKLIRDVLDYPHEVLLDKIFS